MPVLAYWWKSSRAAISRCNDDNDDDDDDTTGAADPFPCVVIRDGKADVDLHSASVVPDTVNHI